MSVEQRQAHACLDLETLGLSLDAVIVSIGAVSWLEGDPPGTFKSIFERSLELNQPGRRIDPDTVAWWMLQSDEARRATFSDGIKQSLSAARADLTSWLAELGTPLVWTNDPSFDAAILKDGDGRLPWPYRNTRCARTAADCVSEKERAGLKKLIAGVGHSAVDDAKLSGAQVQLYRNKTAHLRAVME